MHLSRLERLSMCLRTCFINSGGIALWWSPLSVLMSSRLDWTGFLMMISSSTAQSKAGLIMCLILRIVSLAYPASQSSSNHSCKIGVLISSRRKFPNRGIMCFLMNWSRLIFVRSLSISISAQTQMIFFFWIDPILCFRKLNLRFFPSLLRIQRT